MRIFGRGLACAALACLASCGKTPSAPPPAADAKSQSKAPPASPPPSDAKTPTATPPVAPPAAAEKSPPKAAEDPNRAKRERLTQIARELFAIRKQAESAPAQPPDPAIRQKAEALIAESGRLLTEVVGEDPAKQSDYMEGVIRESMPEEWEKLKGSKLAAQETFATATLKNIVVAEAVFRSTDADGNQQGDYWVADVSGLNRIRRSEQDPKGIDLLQRDVALADARPCVPLDKEGRFERKAGAAPVLMAGLGAGTARSGYLFAALESCEVEVGKWKPYHDGSGRSSFQFGFCAYPERYGETGRHTFIVSESAIVFKKDTGGKPPAGFPMDPAAAGWSPAER
jgi:hypothetical protein